jgi:hypothetical protein
VADAGGRMDGVVSHRVREFSSVLHFIEDDSASGT